MPHDNDCITVCTTKPHDYLLYINSTVPEEQLFVTLKDGREGLYDWDFNVILVPDPAHEYPAGIAPHIEA